MEATAAVASIAGIITLVVQSIDGLVKFGNLLSDASSASRIIGDLLKDIDSLIKTLKDIRDILERSESRKVSLDFGKLDDKLLDCSNDVRKWLSTAKLLRPASEQGGKALFKKLRVAINRKEVDDVKREISRHRLVISLSLEALGRNMDLDNLEQLDKIGDSLHLSLSNHETHTEALRRIENYSKASLHSSAQSICSIDSMQSRLSKLEAMMESTQSKQEVVAAADPRVEDPRPSGRNTPSSATPTESQRSFTQAGRTERRASHIEIHTEKEHRRVSAVVDLERRNKSHFWHSATVHELESSERLLFASYSTDTRLSSSGFPPTHSNAPPSPDCMQLYSELQRSLSESFSTKVARALELRQMLVLHRQHLQMLERGPDQRSPPTIQIRRRMKELEAALEAAEHACSDDDLPVLWSTTFTETERSSVLQ